MSGPEVIFAANAVSGEGGQGEMLRQMLHALEAFPGAAVYSRQAESSKIKTIDLKTASACRFFSGALLKTPVLRRRQDWLTLWSDLDFDRQAAALIGAPDIFEGVAGQCCKVMEKLKGNEKTRLSFLTLNTHIDFLSETMREEYRRMKCDAAPFVHPRMRARTLREMESADRIRVLTHFAKQTCVERGVPASRIDVTYPAVDLDHFHPVEKQDNVFRVMCVATIDPRKGIYYLLQAFEEARIPDSELVLIGGTGSRWAREMLQSFMRRSPGIRHEIMDVTAAPVEENYGRASVVVYPSLEDGSGLGITQGMASGRPVIATRQSGHSELIRDGESGFVIERRSVKDIREKLLVLANDRALCARMGISARRAVQHLGYEAYARSVHAYYERLLA